MALRWYVVHAYSNFEHRVAESLKERIRRAGLEPKFGEILVLCVPGTAVGEVIRLAGPEHFRGKVVIDVTNPIAPAPPVNGVLSFLTGGNDSLMERTQRLLPDARRGRHAHSEAASGGAERGRTGEDAAVRRFGTRHRVRREPSAASVGTPF